MSTQEGTLVLNEMPKMRSRPRADLRSPVVCAVPECRLQRRKSGIPRSAQILIPATTARGLTVATAARGLSRVWLHVEPEAGLPSIML